MKEFKKGLLKAINQYKNICILTHHEPDGDGLPSGLALIKILALLGRDVKVILEEEAPEQYNYLQVADSTLVVSPEMKYDLVIVVDCHDLKRLGTTAFLAHQAKECFIIDHHIADDGIVPGAVAYIEPEVACVGILILDLFKPEIDQLSVDNALYCGECIYTAILNDTNSFMNANTDQKTLNAAATLAEYGVIFGDVTEKYFYNDPWRKLKLVGMTMSTLESHLHDKVLFLHTTQDMIEESEIGIEYLTKVISWVRSAKEMLIIVYFKEADDGSIKLSFRSKSINVAQIASEFNGGGHRQASGGSVDMSLLEAKAAVLERLKECDELRNYLN